MKRIKGQQLPLINETRTANLNAKPLLMIQKPTLNRRPFLFKKGGSKMLTIFKH